MHILRHPPVGDGEGATAVPLLQITPWTCYMRELKALLPYLRRYRGAIAVGLGTVVVSNAVNVASLEYVKAGVDALAVPGTTRGQVGRYALLSALLAVVAGAGRFWMRQILNGVSRKVELDLRDDFFAHLLRLDAGSTPPTPPARSCRAPPTTSPRCEWWRGRRTCTWSTPWSSACSPSCG